MMLREALDGVPDHRSSQGRRHPWGAVLSLAVCAMLCGARSLYAIAQWGRAHRATAGQAPGFPLGKTPCAATLHRVFKDLDVAAFEEVLREWVKDSRVDIGSVAPVDGKTLREIHGEEIPGVHLAPAYAAGSGAALTQAATVGKGQELAADAFSPLETGRGQGPVAAAWQAREWRERVAKLTVWVDESPKQRHGRWERRELWALAGPELNRCAGSAGTAGEEWPHLRQVCRIERQRTVKGRTQTTVSYAVTSVVPAVGGAKRLLRVLRKHWDIGNRVHWVGDVTFDEDRPRVRTGNAPQVTASLRNLTSTLVRWAGHTNVAAVLRRHAARVSEAYALIGIRPCLTQE